MDIFLYLVGLAALTLALNMLYRVTFNLVFIVAQKPIAWMATISIVALLFMFASSLSGLPPGMASWAVLFVFLLNFAPRTPEGIDKRDIAAMADAVYLDIGITNGVIKSRIGAALFAVFSAIGYAAFFGEVCEHSGKCVSLLESLVD